MSTESLDLPSRRMLRVAAGICVFLGIGHLSLALRIAWPSVSSWLASGVWAAVPLEFGAEKTPESLRNALAFWAGPGCFSVPLALLGGLVWHFAGQGIRPPAWVGYGLAAWCVVGGLLLVPSPFFVGAVAGVLVVLAARRRAPLSATSSRATP